jgi:hypothetical protein
VFITSVGHIGQFGNKAKQLTGLCGVFIGVGEIIGMLHLLLSLIVIMIMNAVGFVCLHVTQFRFSTA